MLTYRFNTSINNMGNNLHLNDLFRDPNNINYTHVQYRYENNSIIPK